MILVYLYGIENIANRILQKMKDYVKKSLEEKNQRINERLRQFNKPHLSKGEERVKEFWESQKKTNQDYVNDIIEDNAIAKNSETTINNSTGAIVKNGITIYPDGTRVDSHGTIL